MEANKADTPPLIPSIAQLRIVELASVLAGPAVGQFFAELGAEVIKVENKTTGGDVTRRWKGPKESKENSTSAYYHSVNYGKSVFLLDLQEPAERTRVLEWIASADVVISNFKPASAKKLGMDYESLVKQFPTLIYAELSGFGPGNNRPAFDVVLQAETGWLAMTGEPARAPSKLPVALIDLLAAHQLKEAILVALLERVQTGRGAKVATNLYAAALANLANQATNWLIAGQAPRRIGSQHPNIAPYGDLFSTADGLEVVLACGTESQFRALAQLLGLPIPDKFAANADRVRERAALLDWLRPAINNWKRPALLKAAEAVKVPIGALRTVAEVLDTPANQVYLLERTENETTIRSTRTVVFSLVPS